MHKKSIVILDFGSQYNQLIARRIREMGVYAEIVPYFTELSKIKEMEPAGIILSGGPASVYLDGAPTLSKEIYEIGVPILGICYGMQLTTQLLGGTVERADKQEFGKAELVIDNKESRLFGDIPNGSQVWMSHGDHVTVLAPGFTQIAHTDSCIATMENIEKNIYGVQFHPEVTHSVDGTQILKNFVFKIAKAEANWSMGNYIEQTVKAIKEKVGNKKVILALSGGVDSSVAAVLIHKAIGDQLNCFFVDTGLMRKNEAEKVMSTYGEHFKMNIECVNAEERFLTKLAGVSDPEAKRKIIGNEFVEIFNEEALKFKDADFLAQGTIYPDVIESQSIKGPSATIKSHHNVGGLPEHMKFELLEPLRELFKDEVRKVGRELGSGATEVLFIERCLDLLRDGGRMGIVLPEGVLNSSYLQNAREYFESRAKILLIVSMPQDIFISSGATVKTSLVFLKKFTQEEAKEYETIKKEVTKTSFNSLYRHRKNPSFWLVPHHS